MSVDVASLAIRVESLEARKAQQDLDGLSRAGARSEQSMKALLLRTVSLTAAVAGMAALYRASSDRARQFSTSVSELSAITGATGVELQKLTDASKRFGATTTLSASEAVKAFQLVASAKPDLLGNAEALTATTEAAIRLAEATGQSLPEAANTLGSALNQFGAGAEEADRFINVLAAGSQKGAALVGEVAESLKTAGVVASSAGISFEETNGAIQLLSQFAIKGSESGTALRNVILTLNTSMDENLRPSVVGLGQALENLSDMQLTETQLLDIFDKRSITVAKTLINNRDKYEDLTEAITNTNIAHTQAATRVDNLDGDIKGLNSAYEALLITLGENFMPMQRDVTQQMRNSLLALNDYAESAQGAGDNSMIMAFAMASLSKIAFRAGVEFKDLGDLIGATAAQLAAFATLDFDAARAIGQARRDTRAQLEEEIERYGDIVDFGQIILDMERERNQIIAERNNSEDPEDPDEGKNKGPGEATVSSNQQMLDAAMARHTQGIELIKLQTEAEIAALMELTDLTVEQEQIRRDLIAQIREEEINQIKDSKNEIFAAVEEQYASERDLIRAKAEEQIEALTQLTDLTAEEEQRRADLVAAIRMAEQEQIDAINSDAMDRIYERYATERELAELKAEEQIEALMGLTDLTAEEEQRRADLITEIREGLAENLVKIEERRIKREGTMAEKAGLARLKFEQKTAKEKTDTVLGEMVSMTAGVAQHNKVLFNINKAAAISQAVVDNYSGFMRTMADYPYPINIALAGLSLAAGASQIAAIASTSYEGGGGGTTPSAAGSMAVINDRPIESDSAGGNSILDEVEDRRNLDRDNSIQVVVTGNVGWTPEIIDELAEGLRQATEDRDVVIIGSNSRQAQEITGGGGG